MPRARGWSWCRPSNLSCELPRPRTIVFFVHIPKTGGLSIDSFFCQDKRFETHIHTSSQLLYQLLGRLSEHVANRTMPAKDMYISLHGGSEPSWMQARRALVGMQTRLQSAGMVSDIFTLLREPQAWLRSACEFYPGAHCDSDERKAGLATPDPQCHYLLNGWKGFPYAGVPPSARACAEVLKSLKTSMDWVGTTESLNRSFAWLNRELGMCSATAFAKGLTRNSSALEPSS